MLAATYHQVWWPDATEVKYDGDELPVWDEAIGGYLDPATGEVLPTWDQALDAIDDDNEPWHVARFGVRFDAQGVLAGSKDASPVHRLPDQVPHQAGRRLPPGRHRRRSRPMRRGWLRRCAFSRARRGARTGCGTASSPRTPGRAWLLAAARARPTTLITSATAGAACWSRASGPARRWPTTAPTGKSGCWPCSVFRQPTPRAMPGSPSPRPTRTTWTTPGGCCTPSLTGRDGKPHSTRPDEELPYRTARIFRQQGERRDCPVPERPLRDRSHPWNVTHTCQAR